MKKEPRKTSLSVNHQILTYSSANLLFIALSLISCATYKEVTPVGSSKDFSEISAAFPGKVFRVTLKNGEKIKRLRVRGVDSEKILGTVLVRGSNRQWTSVEKTVLIPDVQRIEKRKNNTGLTVGLVAFLGLVGVVIIAPPFYSVGIH